MDLPKIGELGNEGLDTLALIGGVTLGKVIQGLIKKTGVVPSVGLLVAGLGLSYYAPKSMEKFKIKTIAKGIQAVGGLGFIAELAKDKIDLGLSGIAGLGAVEPITNPIPANIRKYISDTVPQFKGVDLVLNGVDDYVNRRVMPTPNEQLAVHSLFAA